MRDIKFRAWLEKKHNPAYNNWFELNKTRIDRQIGSIKQYEKEIGESFADGFISGMEYNICVSDKGQMMGLEGGWDYQGDIDLAVIEQYTGLKDKNGKEAYHNDIALVGNRKGRIFDRLGCWYVENIGELGYLEGFEIIGNIHKNPELLEGA